jgi:hypothetical protein
MLIELTHPSLTVLTEGLKAGQRLPIAVLSRPIPIRRLPTRLLHNLLRNEFVAMMHGVVEPLKSR